jgi:hypothetical protein
MGIWINYKLRVSGDRSRVDAWVNDAIKADPDIAEYIDRTPEGDAVHLVGINSRNDRIPSWVKGDSESHPSLTFSLESDGEFRFCMIGQRFRAGEEVEQYAPVQDSLSETLQRALELIVEADYRFPSDKRSEHELRAWESFYYRDEGEAKTLEICQEAYDHRQRAAGS